MYRTIVLCSIILSKNQWISLFPLKSWNWVGKQYLKDIFLHDPKGSVKICLESTVFQQNSKIESGRRETYWFCRQNNWTDCFFWFLLSFRSSMPGISLEVACTSHFVSYNLNFNEFLLILEAKWWIFNTWPNFPDGTASKLELPPRSTALSRRDGD